MRLQIFLALFLAAGCFSNPSPEFVSNRRPNLLFIITDDQRFDMMGNVNSDLVTPELDRLANEGVRFENAFVTTPICAASRASMLTGVVERVHGYTFLTPPLAEKWLAVSYPTLLHEVGYYTGYVGKFGIRLPSHEAMGELFDQAVVLNRSPYFKTQPDGSVRHLTDITGDKSIEFIRHAPIDKPWMLCVRISLIVNSHFAPS